MTHHEQSNALDGVVQLLAEQGFDGMAKAIEMLLNEAMKLERAEVLGAGAYERSASRRGHANGFKPKTVKSRLGRLELQVPQTRDVEFYPFALQRGERSKRTLSLIVPPTSRCLTMPIPPSENALIRIGTTSTIPLAG